MQSSLRAVSCCNPRLFKPWQAGFSSRLRKMSQRIRPGQSQQAGFSCGANTPLSGAAIFFANRGVTSATPPTCPIRKPALTTSTLSLTATPSANREIPSLRASQIARHLSSSSPPLSSANSTSGPANRHLDKMSSPYNIRKTGALHTLEHRVFIEERNEILSPFHDIPLYPDEKNKDILNMVVEIPRWTNAKLEISRDDVLNPIKQDSKKDAKAVPRPRFVRNCFPHKGYLWNYGAFPRTWEDPFHEHPDTKAFGDNDPLDVCEIGESVGYTGQVKQVKVLGVMALLDEGETDWKVIVIDIKDNLASKINDIEDVERNLPGLLRATNEWFRIYKIPDSNKENQFAFTGECKNKSYANNVIAECHEAWQKLIKGEVPGLTQGKAPYFLVGKKPHESKEFTISIANRKLEGTPGHITAAPQVGPHEELPPAPMNHEFHRVTDGREWTDVIDVDKWFFISGASPSSTA